MLRYYTCLHPQNQRADTMSFTMIFDPRGTLKTREWKSRHQSAGVVKITGMEIAGEGKVWKAKVLTTCF